MTKGRGNTDQAIAQAIRIVMAATGYSDGYAEDDGSVHMTRRLARQAGLSEKLEDLAMSMTVQS